MHPNDRPPTEDPRTRGPDDDRAAAEGASPSPGPDDLPTDALPATHGGGGSASAVDERRTPTSDRAGRETPEDVRTTGQSAPSRLPPGAPELPGFELLGEIARGGMGVVYRARQRSLDRDVAVKCLPPLFAGDPDRLRRFQNEARLAARLTNHGILPIHDIQEFGGAPVLVMPYVEGSDLGRIVTDRVARREGMQPKGDHPWAALPDAEYLDRVLPLLDRMIDAVTVLHRADILHRDIKPSNILVDGHGDGWLTDFGLARLGDQGAGTVAGQGLGTPGYMSPEQWDGREDLDGRTDVFAVGVTAYQALTLERPYGKGRLSEDAPLPKPPSKQQPLLSPALDAVILHAIQPDRRKRYQTAAELQAEWARARQAQAAEARPGGLRLRWGRRQAVAAGAAAVLIAFVLVAWVVLWHGHSGGMPGQGNGGTPDPRRTVRVKTEPPGADIVFVPLNPDTGEPEPEKAVRAATRPTNPATLRLAPGDYFVEAEIAERGFHQVYRHVPEPGEEFTSEFPHNSWNQAADGAVELRPIQVPKADAAAGMTFFQGSYKFPMGTLQFPEAQPPHHRQVPAYFLDRHEVTVGEYRKAVGSVPPDLSRPPGDAQAVTRVTYGDALAYAERVGRRLPTEAEYEFAATMGGTRDFPWGNDASRITEWPYPPVGQPAFDQTPTHPPVWGLYSNVAEWTSSWLIEYPGGTALPRPPFYRTMRVVRGGPYSVAEKNPQKSEWGWGPRWRHGVSTDRAMPGLGFRCARSQRPAFLVR